MLTADVRVNQRQTALVEIEKLRTHSDGTADYSVMFTVDDVVSVTKRRRIVHSFPRTRYNSLALLRIALETLEPNELELENELAIGP